MCFRSTLFIFAIAQSCVETTILKSKLFGADHFDTGGRSSIEDVVNQDDHILRSDSYQRGAHSGGSFRNEQLNRYKLEVGSISIFTTACSGPAIGESTNVAATHYDRGTNNFTGDRQVDQQAHLRNQERDSGLNVQFQAHNAEMNNGNRENFEIEY